jgi:hypothetical protein
MISIVIRATNRQSDRFVNLQCNTSANDGKTGLGGAQQAMVDEYQSAQTLPR